MCFDCQKESIEPLLEKNCNQGNQGKTHLGGHYEGDTIDVPFLIIYGNKRTYWSTLEEAKLQYGTDLYEKNGEKRHWKFNGCEWVQQQEKN